MDNYTPKQQPQQQQTAVATNYNQAPYYGQAPSGGMSNQQGVSAPSAAPQEPVATPVESAPSAAAQQSNMASKSREVTSIDVEKLAKSVSGMNVGADKQPGQASKLPGTGEHLIKNNNRGNRNSKINVRYNAHGNQPNNSNTNNNSNRVVVPKSDFDFEGSNAKFDKDHIVKEVTHPHDDQYAEADNAEEEEEVVIPPPDDFYDRSKSFFDNISCEAKERQDGPNRYGDNRRKYHEERKLNVETFGQASVEHGRHRGYRGRGGHRGRGLHGGFRGGNRRGGQNRQQQQSQQQNQQSTIV